MEAIIMKGVLAVFAVFGLLGLLGTGISGWQCMKLTKAAETDPKLFKRWITVLAVSLGLLLIGGIGCAVLNGMGAQ